MKPTLDADEWRRILDAVDAEEPPALELAEQLADAVAVDVADAQAAVYDAVDDGPLVEDAGAGGAFGGVRLAAEYRDDETPETPDSDDMEGREAGSSTDNPRGETAETGDADPATVDRWDRAGFDDPDRRVWAPARVEYDAWMCRSDGKAPYAPWTDADAPVECGRDHSDLDVDGDAVTAAECDHHAGYKWGSEGSREYVHECHETAREWAEMDPSLSADLVFIQRERDPFAFVDGDDVRDPETGDPHPAFVALLEHLGVTYADVSTSGTGVHAVYRGSIPLDGVTQATFEIDTEPWGANDDVPEVEIYTGKHVCIATGDHVRGSGTAVAEWDTDALASILAANGYEDDPAPAADTAVDLEDHDPTATTSSETTDDIRDVFHALDRLDARRVAGDTIVHAWNDDASTSAGNRAFAPEWGRNANGTANIVDGEIWQDTGGRGYGGVDVIAAVDCPDLPSYDERTQPGDLRGGDWFRALEHLRDLGYEVPEYDAGGRDDADLNTHAVETCEPPAYDPDTFDRHERWEQLQGARYDAVRDHDGVSVWTDPPGSGKTTNAALGELRRDQGAALLFDKHEKAREVQTDDALPDGFDPFHLKGAAQKRHARCMDADHADEECSEHGHPSNCPSMCPVKDLDADHETRRRYEAVAAEVGDVSAHLLLAEDIPGHGDDGACPWLDQFEEVERAEHVVGVHEYQRLKTVRDGRQTLVDESPSSLRETTYVDIEGLVRTANALGDLADLRPRDDPTKYTAEHFAGFVNDLVDAATGDADLADLDPPAVVWNAYETYDDAAGNYVEREEPAEEWHTAEALAQLKMAYSETIIDRIKREEWDGTPVGLDPVITAAAEAGLSTDAVRAAVATPTVLDSCPWCDAPLGSEHGARVCSSDTCDWDEREHTITQRDGERARAVAYLDDDPNTPAGLGFEQLPLVSDLPDDPLILDATATPSKIAHLYGVDPDAVEVAGDDDLDANMRVTQVLDGQYHAGTVEESDTARERIQSTIDTAGRVHEKPLFVIKKGLRGLFDFPEHGEILHYHAGRGLNRNDCDAVVCIGAPHPDVEDLKREAELLAQGTETRVGGAEHSTRRDAPNPPVYRKLNYEDDDGRGRAVPTKHYTGLVGELFRETREKEIEQMVHRARPLLAEDTVDVYLLTNVPTSLRVDTVCSFDELADPIQALLPVRDGALELLGAVERVARGDGPDGFRAAQLVDGDGETVSHKVAEYHRLARLSGLDVTERTVRNYIDDLDAVGLLDAEAYEHRAGRSYSVDRSTLKAALSVLSYNESFKVAAKRRLRENLDKAASIGEWLDWAKAVFGLGGDRCDLDPPPEMGSTRPTRAD